MSGISTFLTVCPTIVSPKTNKSNTFKPNKNIQISSVEYSESENSDYPIVGDEEFDQYLLRYSNLDLLNNMTLTPLDENLLLLIDELCEGVDCNKEG